METKNKAFDAVAESRKWREATSRKLDAMSRAERLAYLDKVRDRYLAERKVAVESAESCVVREELPEK